MKANTYKNKEASGKIRKVNITGLSDTGKAVKCVVRQASGQHASVMPAAGGGSHRGSFLGETIG